MLKGLPKAIAHLSYVSDITPFRYVESALPLEMIRYYNYAKSNFHSHPMHSGRALLCTEERKEISGCSRDVARQSD